MRKKSGCEYFVAFFYTVRFFEMLIEAYEVFYMLLMKFLLEFG